MHRANLTCLMTAIVAVCVCLVGAHGALAAGGEQSIQLRVSWSGLSAATRLIAEFRRGDQSSRVEFLPADDDQVVKAVADRQCDLGIVRTSRCAAKSAPGLDVPAAGA